MFISVGIFAATGIDGFGTMRHSHQGPAEPYPTLHFMTYALVFPRAFGNIKEKVLLKKFILNKLFFFILSAI